MLEEWALGFEDLTHVWQMVPRLQDVGRDRFGDFDPRRSTGIASGS